MNARICLSPFVLMLFFTQFSVVAQTKYPSASDGHKKNTNKASFNSQHNKTSVTDTENMNPLPSAWSRQDIGIPSATGKTSVEQGVFIIEATGEGISTYSDQCRYVYQTLEGDGEIVAKINGLTSPAPQAQAGIMIRESLKADSKYAMVAADKGNGITFSTRLNTGKASSLLASAGAPPYWIKLGRKGNAISAFKSLNGIAWEFIGTEYIPMQEEVFIGMSVSSLDKTVAGQGRFTEVKISGSSTNAKGIVIDGEASDWEQIPVLASASGSGEVALKAYDDDTYIYLLIEGEVRINYIIFLNTDNNDNTGFNNGLWPSEGSDYSIENGEVYKYNGNGNNWKWSYKGTGGIKSKRNGQIIEVRLAKAKIPNMAPKIKIGVDLESKGWNTVSTIPAEDQSLIHYGMKKISLRLSDVPGNDETLEQSEQVSLSANPFNTLVDFRLLLKEKANVTIEVFDLKGTKVFQVQKKNEPAGINVYGWDGNDNYGNPLPGDIYIGRVKIGNSVENIRLLKY